MADKLVYQSGAIQWSSVPDDSGTKNNDLQGRFFGDFTVEGNLTVIGDSDVITNTISLSVADLFIIQNFGEHGTGVTSTLSDGQSGIAIDRGTYSLIVDPDDPTPANPSSFVIEMVDDIPVWRDDPAAQGVIETDGSWQIPPVPGSYAANPPANFYWDEPSTSWNFNPVIDFRSDQNDGSLPSLSLPENPRLRNIRYPVVGSDAATAQYADDKAQEVQDNLDALRLKDLVPANANNDVIYWDVALDTWKAQQLDIFTDKSPQLGADLDVNGFEIITEALSGQDIVINSDSGSVLFTSPGASRIITDGTDDLSILPGGNLLLNELIWPDADGNPDDVLTTDGIGNLFWTLSVPAGTADDDILYWDGTKWIADQLHIFTDKNPELGADLDVNGFNIITEAGSDQDIVLLSDSGDVIFQAPGSAVITTEPGEDLSLLPSGNLIFNFLRWPNADGNPKDVLTTDGNGILSWALSVPAGTATNDILYWDDTKWIATQLDISTDKSPTLGADLNVDDYKIMTEVTSGKDVVFYADSGVVIFESPGSSRIITDPGDNLEILPGGDLLLKGLTWPNADGNANDVLTTDGAGILGWALSVPAGTAVDDILLWDGARWTVSDFDISIDKSPTLGGDLDVDIYKIMTSGASNQDIVIDADSGTVVFNSPGASEITTNGSDALSILPGGDLLLKGLTWPNADGNTNDVLTTDGAGILGWALSVPAGGSLNDVLYWGGSSWAASQLDISTDSTPTLGGDLDVDIYKIMTSGASNRDIVIDADSGTVVFNSSDVSPSQIVTDAGEDLLIQPGGSLILDYSTWPSGEGNANDVLITNGSGDLSWFTLPDFGEDNTASNLGTGEGNVFAQKSGLDLQFKSLKSGSNITISENATEIEFSSPNPLITTVTAGLGTINNGGNTTGDVVIDIGTGSGITVNADNIAFDDVWGDARYLVISGTAANSTNLNNQPDTYYLNASNLASGILPTLRFNDSSHGSRGGGTLHPDAVVSGSSGFMSGADKLKLDGITAGANPNQNAFGIIAVLGQSDVIADTIIDTLTFVAGTGIELTTDGGTDTVTIINSEPNVTRTIIAGDGLSSLDAGSTTTIDVDATIVRTSGDQSIDDFTTFTSDLTALSFITSSSVRYKDNISEFSDAFDKLMKIDVITYLLKGDESKKRRLGVSAESMATTVPELVSFKHGKPDAVNYAQGFALLVQAMQDKENSRLINKLKRFLAKIWSKVNGN